MNLQDKENIIGTALLLRYTHNTKDPLEIAKRLNIKIVYTDVNFDLLPGKSYSGKTNEIMINKNCTYMQKIIIGAHELGHIVLEHTGNTYYKDHDFDKEYCANLFAVALLFNRNTFKYDLTEMTSYMLSSILELNL